MKTKLFFSLLLGLFSLSQFVHADIKDESSGVSFPSQVTFESGGKTYQLEASGVATRKKFFVKVYSIASYLENGTVTNKSDAFAEILQDNKAKQVTIKWVHEASASKIKDGFHETFSKNLTGEEYAKLKKEIDTYVNFFSADSKVGDENVIRWIPGGNVDVLINGNKVGSIANADFAKALFTFWFGPNSVVNRKDLIKDLK